jgi:hypothetical protein
VFDIRATVLGPAERRLHEAPAEPETSMVECHSDVGDQRVLAIGTGDQVAGDAISMSDQTE